MLTSGQTAEESATNNTPASTSAESVVASGVAGQVSGKIQKLAGISQLTIDPLAASNTADPASQVSIQQRVTGNILLTFSTDVTSTQATTVQAAVPHEPADFGNCAARSERRLCDRLSFSQDILNFLAIRDC